MTISRRSALKAMFAACAAPAIVRAESLMKLYVPRQDLILPESTLQEAPETLLLEGFGERDFTVETWLRPPNGQWQHFAQVRRDGKTLSYLDGKLVANSDFHAHGFKVSKRNGFWAAKHDPTFSGQMTDWKITSLARDPATLSLNLSPLWASSPTA